MSLLARVERFRGRSLWADPERRLRTLEGFAATEEDGGKDLAAARLRVSDPDLRLHLGHHVEDELRHAAFFRRRAAELRSAAAASSAELPDRPYDLSRGRGAEEVDAHGFAHGGLIDELGEVAYVAAIHVAEQRAAELFAVHHDLCQHDPETRAIFEEILRDEKYHVAYTLRFLERWRSEGRGAEVDQALSAARGSRLVGAWKRLGARSAAGFSRAVLLVLYWVVVPPFAGMAKWRSLPIGWRERGPREDARAADFESQY